MLLWLALPIIISMVIAGFVGSGVQFLGLGESASTSVMAGTFVISAWLLCKLFKPGAAGGGRGGERVSATNPGGGYDPSMGAYASAAPDGDAQQVQAVGKTIVAHGEPRPIEVADWPRWSPVKAPEWTERGGRDN